MAETSTTAPAPAIPAQATHQGPRRASHAEIESRFAYLAPGLHGASRLATLYERARDLAEGIAVFTSPGRAQSLALTHLEEALLWAEKALR